MLRGEGAGGRLRRTVGPLTLLATAAAAAAVLAAGGLAAPAGRLAACGLPDAKPLWIDYADGAVGFRDQVFGRSGVIAAASGVSVPAALRKEGAQTVYFELKLPSYVGTPSDPVDPAKIDAAAERMYSRATATAACGSPVIVINELFGASTITPWSPTNTVYRADVLQLLKGLQQRGALPVLLINSLPYTGGDAADWWRQVAQAGWIVVETYFGAPRVYMQGPILANRTMRNQFRSAIQSLTSLGISPGRLGIMLGFQSVPGTGGRESLQPTSAWLQLVKWETLAAKEVADETRISTVMSWGWASFSTGANDHDKAAAACVYLWARDPALCDGPTAAGPGFDTSLTEGQLDLGAGVQCVIDGQSIAQADVDALAAVTRDRDAALTALFQRAVESAAAPPVDPARVLGLERSVILNRFGGSRAAYVAALARAHATVDIARAILADQLRRNAIADKLPVPQPTDAQVADYYATYANLSVRTVAVSPAAPWLAGRGQGFAIQSFAPPQVFTLAPGQAKTFDALDGRYTVRTLDGATPLGAIPLERIRPVVRAALAGFARNDAFTRWSAGLQAKALGTTLCLGDRLPVAAGVDLTAYLPYLAIRG